MLLLTPSQSTLDYYSTSLSSLGNATAESPLSFQHLGVHWGRSAPRLWLHHRSRPPAGWFCDGIRFLWAQPCSAKCQIFKDSQATYATFFFISWTLLQWILKETASGDLVPSGAGAPGIMSSSACASSSRLMVPEPSLSKTLCEELVSVWARCFKWGFP